MPRDIYTISVGGAGIALGFNVWRQYCLEHNIDFEGKLKDKNPNDTTFHGIFDEIGNSQYKPRAIFVDLDPDTIDHLKVSKYAKLFDDGLLLAGKEDTGGCFARGQGYGIGMEMMGQVNDALRKCGERVWDYCQGFIINHSVGGGTGSGLTSLILERLGADYKNKTRIGFEIYPFDNNHSNNYIEPYNTLLSTHSSLQRKDVSFIYDNRQMYNICKNILFIDEPHYFHINSIITKMISSITHSVRFEGGVNAELYEIQSTMVSFPRLHYLISSMAPLIVSDFNKPTRFEKKLIDGYVRQNCIVDRYRIYQDILNTIYSIFESNIQDKISIEEFTADLFNTDYFSVECVDFDNEEDKYMAVNVHYRNVRSATANYQYFRFQKSSGRGIHFVEWAPTGTKFEITDTMPPLLPEDHKCFKMGEQGATVIGNSCCISRFFSERISKWFDRMYSQRAFIHWFRREKMEDEELKEAREDLGFLEKDYLDVLSEPLSDSYGSITPPS